ncbi:MAG TPA: cyclic nucleotide-binding domain-containing protein, partial [Myxococcota bacterium]|nr:cyclic nucleotide-binding domain-containing protein [Myxococcota bacterium]
PGEVHGLVGAPAFHPILSARVLRALKFLDLNDPGWLAAILYQGRSRKVDTGAVLARPTDEANGKILSVIVAGTAVVASKDGKPFTSLHPGEFFGMIELVDSEGRHQATVQAETPMELFDIDAQVIHEYAQRNGLDEALQRIWAQRPLVENIKMFRRLDVSSRNEVARVATEEHYGADEVIISEGSGGDDFFLLVEGEVSVESKGKPVNRITASQHDNFFGEITAIRPDKQRSATVRAVGPVRTLRMHGAQIRTLFNAHMAVRYILEVAIRTRGGQTS